MHMACKNYPYTVSEKKEHDIFNKLIKPIFMIPGMTHLEYSL